MVVQVRSPAPKFNKAAVCNGTVKHVSLDQYRNKWVVLMFIPQAFTFVCPTEVIAYSEMLPKFKERGAEVVFASTDSEFSLMAWDSLPRAEGGLGKVAVPLLSDQNHSLARDYGVLLEDEGIALRSSFLIDDQGIIRQVTTNDTTVGRSVEESLRLLDAYQFADKYGQVCPVNWHKGDEGINNPLALDGLRTSPVFADTF